LKKNQYGNYKEKYMSEELNEFDMSQYEISGRIIDEAYNQLNEEPLKEEPKVEEKKVVFYNRQSDENILGETMKRMMAKSLLNEMDLNFANPYSPAVCVNPNIPQEYHPSEFEVKTAKIQKISEMINQNIYKLRDLERDKNTPGSIDIDPESKMMALIKTSIGELINLLFMTWNGATPPAPPKEEEKKEVEEVKKDVEEVEKKVEEVAKEEKKEEAIGDQVTSPEGEVYEILEIKDNDVIVSDKTKKKYIVERRIIKKWIKEYNNTRGE
jgi:tetrahydromethanopterin S-methyltransferase subunit G